MCLENPLARSQVVRAWNSEISLPGPLQGEVGSATGSRQVRALCVVYFDEREAGHVCMHA